MTHQPSQPPPSSAGPGPAAGRAALRAWESFWVRLSLKVGVMVVATVAIFMLPKIAGRSTGLKTRAEARTDIWRHELVESGRVTREAAPAADRTRDVAIIAGLVTTAAVAVAGAAYVALRPRSGGSPGSDTPIHSEHTLPDRGSS